jgi:futalosine hydrolase
MQTILLSCTTELEAIQIRYNLNKYFKHINLINWKSDIYNIHLNITGAGIPFVMLNLQRTIHLLQPNYLIHFGIAGIKQSHGRIGDVVELVRDQFGDIGIFESDEQYKSMFDIGLWDGSVFPFENQLLVNNLPLDKVGIPKMDGITVNSIPGSQSQQDEMARRGQFQVESMEGAAVFLTSLQYGIPFCALRGISNYLEPRDRTTWDLEKPLTGLSDIICDLLSAGDLPIKPEFS